MSSRAPTGLEIAVIGMAARLPGSADLDAFWPAVRRGDVLLSRFGRDELLGFGRSAEEVDDPDFIPVHGAIDGVDAFDKDFFQYSDKEAALIDPQQRIFLETAYHALDDAGLVDAADLRIGLFAGASANTYLRRHVLPGLEGDIAGVFQGNYSNHNDFLCTRVSYKLGLTGPSVTVQSACSTSLVAVALACQGLLAGSCDAALAGGVSVSLPSERGYRHQQGMIFSPDGACRPFDHRAAGTLKGDGAGVVVLKRLEDALADGDRIDAVILGSAVNNDGADKVGYTAPGFHGQVGVIREAQELAGIDPSTIGYIEAHGTATPIGDPLEIAALSEAFRDATDRRQFAAIGSVKGTIGHLDAAAGVAGLIKAILSVRDGVIPPSPNFEAPNPAIDFAGSPVFPARTETPYPEGIRRAAVSSFGIGGSNAHLILEEPPVMEPAPMGEPLPRLMAFSAHSIGSRNAMAEALAQCPGDVPLAGLARTLRSRRGGHRERAAVVIRNEADARGALRDLTGSPFVVTGSVLHDPQAVFLFPGQGAQLAGMGHDLARQNAVFGDALSSSIRHLRAAAGVDLSPLLSADAFGDRHKDETLRQTALAQPALVAIGLALAAAWRDAGITPRLVLGHSIGELAAAAVAGVFSAEDALELAALRGRLMQACPPGAMVAVSLGAEEAQKAAAPFSVDIAALNSAGQTVLSGTDEAIEAFCQSLPATVTVRRLKTSHGFHSRLMTAAAEPFAAEVARREPRDAAIDIVSTVDGGRISPSRMSDPDYWRRNILDPVRFVDAARKVAEFRSPFALELGPGSTCLNLLRKAGAMAGAQSLHCPQGKLSEGEVFLRAIGALWCSGFPVDIVPLTGGEGRFVRLPPYPFTPTRCWIEAPPPGNPVRSATEPYVGVQSFKRVSRLETREAPKEPSVSDLSDWRAWIGDAPERLVIRADGGARVEDALDVMRALAENRAARKELTLLTNGAYSVFGDEPLTGDALCIAALIRVGCQEQGIAFRHVDGDGGTPDSRLAGVRACGDVALVRASSVWERHVEPAGPRESSNGINILLGGGGEVGLTLARELLDAGEEVVLVVRDQHRLLRSPRFAQLFGVRQPDILEADVTDSSALARVVATLRPGVGQPVYIAHLAGIVGNDAACPLTDLTADELSRQMRPKADGCRAIDKALADGGIEPHAVILFSSLASALGGRLSAAYGAANAALDAFALAKERERGVRWVSVAWDQLESHGMRGLAPRAVLRFYQRARVGDHALLVATARPSDTLYARPSVVDQAPPAGDLSPETEDMADTLLAVWREVFANQGIAATDNFFELGGDSVISLQIVSKARSRGVHLTAEQVFEKQTVERIAAGLGAERARDDAAPGTERRATTPSLGGLDLAALEDELE